MPRRPAEAELQSQLGAIFLLRARAAGVPLDELLKRSGLPLDPREWPTTPLPMRVFRALSDEVAERMRDPFFGLHVALELQRGSYGLVEFICRSEPTIGAGFDRLIRYQRLIGNRIEYSLRRTGSDAIFEHRVIGEPLAAGRHGNEFTIAALIRLGTMLSGSAMRASRVWFAHPRPKDVSELTRFFETDRLDFGQPANGMRFAAEVLERPILTADDSLNALLEAQAERELQLRPVADDFLARVREQLRASMRQGATTATRVAAGLKMSPRTLQRRLEDEGTTFQAVLDEVRHALALNYLGDASLKLGHVAFLLGYTDPRSFVRAFKRWTGKSPEDYRAAR
jgi:AraC-like DNA-binding protein